VEIMSPIIRFNRFTYHYIVHVVYLLLILLSFKHSLLLLLPYEFISNLLFIQQLWLFDLFYLLRLFLPWFSCLCIGQCESM